MVVFVSESPSGDTLRNYIGKIKRPFLKIIKRWAIGILEALAYLHSQEPFPIVHKEIMADSLFVNKSTGECLIGDLGLYAIKRMD
jgi:WNK lysine deficient protein kinase